MESTDYMLKEINRRERGKSDEKEAEKVNWDINTGEVTRWM